MQPSLAGVFFTIRATWEAPLNWDLWKKVNSASRNFLQLVHYLEGPSFVTRNLPPRMLLKCSNNILHSWCQFSSVQSLSCVQLFVTPWTAVRQASLSITNSWSLLKLMSIESVMPSKHLILCSPLLLPRSIIPCIRIFSNESVFCSRWPKYWSFTIQNTVLQNTILASLDSLCKRCNLWSLVDWLL